MSETTKIEWANHTGGPYLGCSPVSLGCVNCYAWVLALSRLEPIFRRANRAAGFADWDTRPVWGDKATRVLSKGFWHEAVAINKKHAKAGTRGKWFPSMIDWLDEMPGGIIDQEGNRLDPIAVLQRFLRTVHATPSLTWLLLSKRPENWLDFLTAVYDLGKFDPTIRDFSEWLYRWLHGEPPDHVWVGASVENQDYDWRVVELLKIPAAGRFLSLEPLLGSVDFLTDPKTGDQIIKTITFNSKTRTVTETRPLQGINWIIIGGESGHGARPCNVEWIHDIVRQCKVAGVPAFVKQLGAHVVSETSFGWPPGGVRWGHTPYGYSRALLRHPKGGDPAEWPEDLRVREFPEGLR